MRLYACFRIAGRATPLRPMLHADNTGKREIALRVLDADIKGFMMPKDMLHVCLFPIGKIFQVFGIERLAYREITLHLHPSLRERYDGEIRHALGERTRSPELRDRSQSECRFSLLPTLRSMLLYPNSAYICWINTLR